MGIELPDVIQQPSRVRIARHVAPDGEVTWIPYRWDGQPHYPLMYVMKGLRRARGSDTDRIYARWFLHFETYAERELGVRWDDSPERVRSAYIAYLESQQARVTERGGHHSVHVPPVVDPFPEEDTVNDTVSPKRLSKSTLRLQHEALRTIYETALEVKLYEHQESPMTRFVLKQDGERRRRDHPFVPTDWNRERDPDRIFHLVDGEWVPHLLMNDARLSDSLRTRFAPLDLRDRCILELLLTSGARLSEVCGATLHGWAAEKTDGRPFGRAMWATSKGTRGVASKRIGFSAAGAALLRENFVRNQTGETNPLYGAFSEWVAEGARRRGERQTSDPVPEPESYFRFLSANGYSTEIPLFLTMTGRRAYTGPAFREGPWRTAMGNGDSQLRMRPHQIRHWYVTLVLLQIEWQYRLMPAERDSARQAFVRHMGWKSGDRMLEVYDRALETHGLANQWTLIAQVAEARLEGLGVDLTTFLQEMDAVDPDELEDTSDVGEILAVLQA